MAIQETPALASANSKELAPSSANAGSAGEEAAADFGVELGVLIAAKAPPAVDANSGFLARMTSGRVLLNSSNSETRPASRALVADAGNQRARLSALLFAVQVPMQFDPVTRTATVGKHTTAVSSDANKSRAIQTAATDISEPAISGTASLPGHEDSTASPSVGPATAESSELPAKTASQIQALATQSFSAVEAEPQDPERTVINYAPEPEAKSVSRLVYSGEPESAGDSADRIAGRARDRVPSADSSATFDSGSDATNAPHGVSTPGRADPVKSLNFVADTPRPSAEAGDRSSNSHRESGGSPSRNVSDTAANAAGSNNGAISSPAKTSSFTPVARSSAAAEQEVAAAPDPQRQAKVPQPAPAPPHGSSADASTGGAAATPTARDAPAPARGDAAVTIRQAETPISTAVSANLATLRVDLANGQTTHAAVREHAGKIEVNVVTQTQQAAQRVGGEFDALRRALDTAGLNLVKAEVNYRDDGQGDRQYADADRNRRQGNATGEVFSLNEVNE
jgi:hypothetical protein